MKPGDIISYSQMCMEEGGGSLQKGMNYRLRGRNTVILMSLQPNAPYADAVLDDGKILIYEGHDINNRRNGPDPKTQDQPMYNPNSKTLTANGKFYEAAKNAVQGEKPELVRVYEKIKAGIWSFNGIFELVDANIVNENNRKVFKFTLHITDKSLDEKSNNIQTLEHNRMIPSQVKLEVWKRDGGKCTTCGSSDNLHYDHILPFSKGGSSLVASNIQLLCARHNLVKSDKIE
ncbi:HNH endonuclease [Pseudobdellovibrio exovorus]|uniref:HNH nuclease domain-containing protein n=1 Tax=Pseudobdellovibrio exovorus JSS TaxID=1184267 RepID=M4VTV8_9BACT|nr:HNH endonuclease [Pseudobdellovibrio exovorus]AGH96639.1 hypothetical protein A11Q_2423 [Pseudobdellovibrio exovorus JSS]